MIEKQEELDETQTSVGPVAADAIHDMGMFGDPDSRAVLIDAVLGLDKITKLVLATDDGWCLRAYLELLADFVRHFKEEMGPTLAEADRVSGELRAGMKGGGDAGG